MHSRVSRQARQSPVLVRVAPREMQRIPEVTVVTNSDNWVVTFVCLAVSLLQTEGLRFVDTGSAVLILGAREGIW